MKDLIFESTRNYTHASEFHYMNKFSILPDNPLVVIKVMLPDVNYHLSGYTASIENTLHLVGEYKRLDCRSPVASVYTEKARMCVYVDKVAVPLTFIGN